MGRGSPRSADTATELSIGIGGVEIEWVNSYKYLGVIVSYDGKYYKALADRIEKATNAMYSVRNAISHNENISTALANTLFDKQISPILLLWQCTMDMK